MVDVGPFHPLEELPRIGRQRLDVAALALGIDRVEGERRLPRPADAGDDAQLARREGHVDVLEVMRTSAANDDRTKTRTGRIVHIRLERRWWRAQAVPEQTMLAHRAPKTKP
jgi:hypothetical protein